MIQILLIALQIIDCLVNYIELYVYAIVHSIFNCRLLTVDRSATFVYN